MRNTLTSYSPAAPTRPVDVIGLQRLKEEREANRISSSTQPLSADLSALIKGLQPGQRIRITQTVRVGRRSWPAQVEGTFRGVKYLATGLATERVAEDEIVVVAVHFTKDNGELSSVTLDENSRIEALPS